MGWVFVVTDRARTLAVRVLAATEILLGVATVASALAWALKIAEPEPWTVLLGGFVLLLEPLRRRLGEASPPTINAADLVDEAVFSMMAPQWVNGQFHHDWVLEQLRTALGKTILIPEKAARRALARAERAYEEYSRPELEEEWRRRLRAGDYHARHPGYVLLEKMLSPVIQVLRPKEDYRKALRALPPGQAAHALKTGYHRKAAIDDFWAYCYLIIMAELGETETLVPLLEERLKDPTISLKAGNATLDLGEKVMGSDTYGAWYDRMIEERNARREEWEAD